jgi:ABC-type sugar transport system permease subunit
MDVYKARNALVPYLFMLPALAFYIVFLLYPMGYSLFLSFSDWDGLQPIIRMVGIANYSRIFLHDPVSRLALRNNAIWIVFTLLVPNAIGLLLAVALNQKLRGTTLLRTIFYSPAVLPLVAAGLIWAWMYNPNFGLINNVLRAVGLEQWAMGWLGDPRVAQPAILFTYVWQHTGFPMVLYLAGLQGIPQEQYEAARIDGASAAQSFYFITLPLLRETHIIVITLGIIYSLKIFDLVYSMTWGGPGYQTQVLATWMYFNTFHYHKAGLGSAIAWVIAVITMLVTFPYLRIMTRR